MFPRTHPQLLLLVAFSLTLWPQPAGAQWPVDGRALCTATGDQQVPKIVSDGAGGAIVTWNDDRSGSGTVDIYAQHVLASGAVDPAWPVNGRALCTATGTQWYPEIVPDGAGGAIITWMDYRDGNYDIYAQHVLGTGAVDPAWPVNGRALCTATGDQQVPKIVSDGAGGAIVTWEDARISPPAGDWDIYAQHLPSTGEVDPAWPVNGRAVCTASGAQNGAAIVSDDAGGAIVTWYDQRIPGGIVFRDIYAQHVLSAGGMDPEWLVDGRAVCAASGDQFTPWAVSDGAGGAIVTWTDERSGSGNYDVYSQRVLSAGVVDPAWPLNGRALCTAGGNQWAAAIVTDDVGGALVTWHDNRSGSDNYDVYTQRVLNTGVVDPAWPLDGSALCTVGGNQFAGSIVSDGAAGAIVAWRDGRRRPTSPDIYAQHVFDTGEVDRPPDGLAICTVSGSQENPRAVADGAGGAIVTWQDRRGGTNYDIYAQHVYGGGGVAAVSPGRVEQFEVRAPHPNPAHAGAAISFDLVTAQRVSVSVYDASGQLVRTLAAERELPAGSQNLVWDGASDAGTPASAGVYFVRVTAGGASVARRVTILR